MPVGAVLVETQRAGLLREEDVLYRNGRFALIKAQPTVVITEEGFYSTETVEGQSLHWMPLPRPPWTPLHRFADFSLSAGCGTLAPSVFE